MKIQQLTIHNIASIEDATIHFDAAPLSESDVFLITGNTGAGKSTILDAICLALYADTPRMRNTAMQGNIHEGDKTFKVDDTRQMMRRHTGEAFVRLSFIDSNGVPYEAEWSVARAHKKPHGNLQKKIWTLKNLHTHQVLTRDNEIKGEMEAAIGLDFNQFCRTTILAQGEFTRFLNSEDKDKASILEKITGVDVYSKIGAKIYEMTTEKKQSYEEVRQLTENINVFNDEDVAEKLSEIERLNMEYESAKQSKAFDEGKRKWLVDSQTIDKNLQIAIQESQQANQLLESEAHKNNEKLVAEWKQTIEIREWKRQLTIAQHEEKKQRQALEDQSIKYQCLLDGIKDIQKEMASMEKTIDDTTLFLKEEEAKSDVYEKSPAITNHIQSIMEGRKKMEDWRKRAVSIKEMIQGTLKEKIEEAQEKHLSAQAAYISAHNNQKAHELELEEKHLSSLRDELEKSQQRLEKLRVASESITTLDQEKVRRVEASKSLALLQETIASLEKDRDNQQQVVHDIELQHATWEKSLQLQRTTVEKWAKSIRLTLQQGDVCPVCQQSVTSPLPHEDALDAMYREVQEAYAKIDKTLREQQQQLVKVNAEISSHQALYNRNQKSFDQDQNLVLSEAKARQVCHACGIDTIGDDTLTLIDKERQQVEEKIHSLKSNIDLAERLERSVKAERKDTERKRDAADAALKAFEKAKQNMVKYESDLSTIGQLMENEHALISNWEKDVRSLLSNHEWQNDWQSHPVVFIDELKRAVKKYQNQTKILQDTTLKLSNHRIIMEHVTKTRDEIVEQMPLWKAMEGSPILGGTSRNINPHDLPSLANNILTDVRMGIDLIGMAIKEQEKNQLLLDCFMSENPQIDFPRLTELSLLSIDDINRMEQEIKRMHDIALAKRTQLEQVQRQREDLERNKPHFDEGDTLQSLEETILKKERQMADFNERKGGIIQQLKKDEENKRSLKQLLDECERRKTIYDQWMRMNQLLGDAKGEKFKKIAQSYILGSLIHSANSYMRTLSDRYTLKVTPGTFIISIEDAYQGYAARASTTISGGESFLVSLSLALALSDIGTRLSVDTLFIDEGFGTLSGEPLQNAIHTLHTLHAKSGRHVGIISHVEELRERIPVQIQVIQEGNSSKSSVKVVGT